MTKPFDAQDPSTWAVTFNRELSQDEINFYAPQMQVSWDRHMEMNKVRAAFGMEPLSWKYEAPAPTPENDPASPFVIGGTSAS